MPKIGQLNRLRVLERTQSSFWLEGDEEGDIPLPLELGPPDCSIGTTLEVFLYYDSNDELAATTRLPYALVGECACLEVVSLESVGAFLDWGLPKDLFLPYREQTRELRVGQRVIVFVYLDNTDRVSASMRLDRHVDRTRGDYREGEAVQLLIAGETEIGYKAIVNHRHYGVLYRDEVFQPLSLGQRLTGFVSKVREDGKLDLRLHQSGYKDADHIGQAILDALEHSGGFLPVTDHSAPEAIYDLFGVSKKKYKMAIGGLYKNGIIVLEARGIRRRR